MDVSRTTAPSPYPKPLAFMHLDTTEAGARQMLANLTLSGLGPCDLCPSLIAEGL